MNEYDIIIRPIITEKSTNIKDLNNQYVFEVRKDANKIEVKRAIENLFKVKVLSVRIINMKGKERRVGRIIGRRRNWKKAIVKVSPEDKIPIFEGA
ncbi:MAG: 50S ribosomal protein L23 [Desulfobacterota bacterium]|nr:50S ribosomal protein L23 [Thermodesulfobacteriota bacterium]MDW8002376.1 50S ribosomal protein L23 [Deltaproteobacteria bacterium]